MKIEFPLTGDVRRLFEWIARQRQQGELRVTFEEAKKALGAPSDRALHDILKALKTCRSLEHSVIKEIHRGGSTQEACFVIDDCADTAWHWYLRWEKKEVAPLVVGIGPAAG